jgi:hypothetical protein
MSFTKIAATVVLGIVLTFLAPHAQAAWVPLGSPRFDAPVVEVQLDPMVPGVLYGRVAGDVFRSDFTWKSEDGGTTWRSLQPGLLRPSSALAIDPVDTRILWAWTTHEGGTYRAGLWRSTDGGLTWTQRHLAPENTVVEVLQLLADPSDPQTLYRVERSRTGVHVGVSRDGGASFTVGPELRHSAPLDAVAVHGPRRELLAFTDDGLRVSVDGGRSWQLRGWFGKRRGLLAGALAPSRPDRIYAVPGRGSNPGPPCLVRSDDAGRRWQELAAPRIPGSRSVPRCWSVTVDPRDEDHLWVVTVVFRRGTPVSGVSESTDGGRSWSVRRPLPDGDLRLSAGHEGRVYAHGGWGSGRGLYRSADGGRNWVDLHRAITSGDARRALFAVPVGPQALIAHGTGLNASTDGGRHWQPLLANRVTEGIAHAGGEKLVAAVRRDPRIGGMDLLRSLDIGMSWWGVASPPPIPFGRFENLPTIFSDVVDANHLAVSGADPLEGTATPWLSDDGGLSWQASAGPETRCLPPLSSFCARVHAYAVDPAAPSRRWISFDVVDQSSIAGPRLLRSTNGGATWQLIAELDAATLGVLVDRTIPGRVLAGNETGLMASDDFGEHWHAFGQGIPAGAGVRQLLREGTSGPLYATTTHGIFRSADGGATWTRLDGEPDLDRPRLALHGTTLLAAFRGQGVWRWSP